MSDEIVKLKVYVTHGNKVVETTVLDLTPEECQNIRAAMDQFLSVTKQLDPDFPDTALQTVIERVDASGRPADDPMSYTFANNELRREARKQLEDAIKARERESQSVAREVQRQADREEYLRPSDRPEVARELQQNQPELGTSTRGPDREYTNAEIEAMSADEMVRCGIVNRPLRIDQRQGSSGVVLRPERAGERRERKIKFSSEELESQEYRKRVIANDQAERRKMNEDRRRALEAQEEKKWNERKRRS